MLRWLEGRGWLVLSGGSDVSSEVRVQVLERAAAADGGVAYLSLKPEDDSVIDDLNDLGAPVGYTVDLMAETDEEIIKRVSEASIVVVEDSGSPSELMAALSGAGLKGLEAAYSRGAVVLAEGQAASIFGAFVPDASGGFSPGLGWLQGVFVLPGVSSATDSEQVRAFLLAHPENIAVGIAVGAGLALGPGGQIEIWGSKKVTIALSGSTNT